MVWDIYFNMNVVKSKVREMHIVKLNGMVCCSPDDHLDFAMPESSLPDALPVCDVSPTMSKGPDQLEEHWDAMVARFQDAYRGEAELTGIVEDFDCLIGDNQRASSLSMIGRRIAYSLRRV